MPTPPDAAGQLRPSAVVNGEIRALMRASGGWLRPEDRERYQQLRAEWAEAVRRELDEAA